MAELVILLLFAVSAVAPSAADDNVTATVGQKIEIPCGLKATADGSKIVWQSWDRRTILTVDHRVVTQDERISSDGKGDGSWSLLIDNVRPEDAGQYRCQIDTSLSRFSDIYLRVKGCGDGEFACADEVCIARAYRCDGLNNCADGEDEDSCSPEECRGTNIYCGNGKCIPLQYFCDENDDCGNGFDERNCSRPLPVDCPAGEFPCGDGECIPLKQHCNGKPDCENGADELAETCRSPTEESATTPAPECAPAASCGDGKCVPSSWWCDGEVDCDNAADEKHCAAEDCRPETTHCGNGRCVKGRRCDGKSDCIDTAGYDEENCSARECFLGARYCGNGRCVASHMICDGIDQCGNGADEKFCDPGPAESPISQTLRSSVAAPEPLRASKVMEPILRASNDSVGLQRLIASFKWRSCKLNYEYAVGALSPEDYTRFGGPLSKGDRFFCDMSMGSGESVPIGKRCDGRRDCASGRDELGCNVEEVCGRDPTLIP